jgi:predicted  nucleic acid-binding Zn-ribbon protein
MRGRAGAGAAAAQTHAIQCNTRYSLSLSPASRRPAIATRTARPSRCAAEVEILKLKDKLKEAEEALSSVRRTTESASDVAVSSERRLAALGEEAERLRGEAKSLRAGLAAAQKEADEQRAITSRALADVEASEAAQAEAEAALAAARSAEAAAHRVLSSYEDQIRELRSQLAALQSGAGAREDELRRDLDDMTAKWLRAQAAAEENGLMALAQAFGLNVAVAGQQQHNQQQQGAGGDDAGKAAAAGRLAATLGAALGDAGAGVSVVGGGGAAGAGAGVTGGGGTAATITEALIGQLAALQAELQSKRDGWAAQRSALQARVAAAEAAAEAADADVKRAEASAVEASNAAAGLRTELIALRGAKARADAEAALLGDKLRDAEARVVALAAAHDAAQRQLGEAAPALAELRLRCEEHAGARAAAGHMVSVLKDQLVAAQEEAVALKREAAGLQREVVALQAATARAGGAPGAGAPLFTGRGGDGDAESAWLQSAVAGGRLPASASSMLAAAAAASGSGDGSMGGGLLSGLSPMVQATITALERERDMMTEQVVALSGRLAQVDGAWRCAAPAGEGSDAFVSSSRPTRTCAYLCNYHVPPYLTPRSLPLPAQPWRRSWRRCGASWRRRRVRRRSRWRCWASATRSWTSCGASWRTSRRCTARSWRRSWPRSSRARRWRRPAEAVPPVRRRRRPRRSALPLAA